MIEHREGVLRPAPWAAGLAPSGIQRMLPRLADPAMINFALGLPAVDLLPNAALQDAAAALIAASPLAFQYGTPPIELRRHVARLMAERGVACAPEDVFLTAGAQQGLQLLVRLLAAPGADVIVEAHTYSGFTQILAPFDVRVRTVPSDPARGIDLAALEALLASGLTAPLLYLTPTGQNPTGATLDLPARERLVALARRHRLMILEDDPYGLLVYDGAPLPPLRALGADVVAYVGSFSKTVAPALRAGWIVAPAALRTGLSFVKEACDLDTGAFTHRVLARYLDGVDWPAHVAARQGAYRDRRDAMLQALEAHMPAGVTWNRPAAGFFIWLTLPAGVGASALLPRALDAHVAFLPGKAFAAAPDAPDATIRLSFSNVDPVWIGEGVARLAAVLRA